MSLQVEVLDYAGNGAVGRQCGECEWFVHGELGHIDTCESGELGKSGLCRREFVGFRVLGLCFFQSAAEEGLERNYISSPSLYLKGKGITWNAMKIFTS